MDANATSSRVHAALEHARAADFSLSRAKVLLRARKERGFVLGIF